LTVGLENPSFTAHK